MQAATRPAVCAAARLTVHLRCAGPERAKAAPVPHRYDFVATSRTSHHKSVGVAKCLFQRLTAGNGLTEALLKMFRVSLITPHANGANRHARVVNGDYLHGAAALNPSALVVVLAQRVPFVRGLDNQETGVDKLVLREFLQ